jgi:hypothetical protein
MEERFNRRTFESPDFLLEAAEAPKIKAGGSSSSNILNRFFSALAKDLSLLGTRTNLLATRSSRVESMATQQGAALQAAFQGLATAIEAVTGGVVFAEMHSQRYVHPSTTADVDQTFGQATLPVRSSTNLLVQTDVYGNPFVSPEVEVSYAHTAVQGSPPGSLSFQVDPEGIYMLRGEQMWVRPDGNTDMNWVKVRAPLQFRGLTPNVLEIWPAPSLIMDLAGVWYRKAGDSSGGTWYSVDISYLPGYQSGSCKHFGGVRVILPNEPISEIAIGLKANTATAWGLERLEISHVEYESSATLIVREPFSRTISSDVVLRGKDPSNLALLSLTVNANQASIAMTSTDSSRTPVITGAILRT